jgi:hypothetical protein
MSITGLDLRDEIQLIVLQDLSEKLEDIAAYFDQCTGTTQTRLWKALVEVLGKDIEIPDLDIPWDLDGLRVVDLEEIAERNGVLLCSNDRKASIVASLKAARSKVDWAHRVLLRIPR